MRLRVFGDTTFEGFTKAPKLILRELDFFPFKPFQELLFKPLLCAVAAIIKRFQRDAQQFVKGVVRPFLKASAKFLFNLS